MTSESHGKINSSTAIKLFCLCVLFFTFADCARADVTFDSMTWYDSHIPSTMSINAQGQLQWIPYNDHQIIVRLPEKDLSDTGDVVEISYYWLATPATSSRFPTTGSRTARVI